MVTFRENTDLPAAMLLGVLHRGVVPHKTVVDNPIGLIHVGNWLVINLERQAGIHLIMKLFLSAKLSHIHHMLKVMNRL